MCRGGMVTLAVSCAHRCPLLREMRLARAAVMRKSARSTCHRTSLRPRKPLASTKVRRSQKHERQEEKESERERERRRESLEKEGLSRVGFGPT